MHEEPEAGGRATWKLLEQHREHHLVGVLRQVLHEEDLVGQALLGGGLLLSLALLLDRGLLPLLLRRLLGPRTLLPRPRNERPRRCPVLRARMDLLVRPVEFGYGVRLGLGELDADGLVEEGEALHGTQGVGGVRHVREDDEGLATLLQCLAGDDVQNRTELREHGMEALAQCLLRHFLVDVVHVDRLTRSDIHRVRTKSARKDGSDHQINETAHSSDVFYEQCQQFVVRVTVLCGELRGLSASLLGDLDEDLFQSDSGHAPILGLDCAARRLHELEDLRGRHAAGRKLEFQRSRESIGLDSIWEAFPDESGSPFDNGRCGDEREDEVASVALRQGLGIADHLEPSIHEDAQSIAQHLRLLHVVRRQDDRLVLLGLLDDLPQVAARGGIQSGAGLVQVDHSGTADEGDGDGEAPLHAAAVLLDLQLRHASVEEVDGLEGVLGGLLQLRVLQPLEPSVEQHVFEPRQRLPQQIVLRTDAHHRVEGLHVLGDVQAFDVRLA